MTVGNFYTRRSDSAAIDLPQDSFFASDIVVFPQYTGFAPAVAEKLEKRIAGEYRESLTTTAERVSRSAVSKWLTATDGDTESLEHAKLEVTFERADTHGMDTTLVVAEIKSKFKE